MEGNMGNRKTLFAAASIIALGLVSASPGLAQSASQSDAEATAPMMRGGQPMMGQGMMGQGMMHRQMMGGGMGQSGMGPSGGRMGMGDGDMPCGGRMGGGMGMGMGGGGMHHGMHGDGMQHRRMGHHGMHHMAGKGMMRDGMPGGMAGHMRVRPLIDEADAAHFFKRYLERLDNDRLKLGKVETTDEDTITAEIVTVDDSLVQTFTVDRASGRVSTGK
jgi:hypothetical protein